MGAKKDIKVYQGDTFEMVVIWKDANNSPIDLTDYTGAMKIIAAYNSANVLANAVVSIAASNGQVTATIPASNTAAIPVANNNSVPPRATYYYDLRLTSNTGTVTTLLWGSAIVQASVS